MQFSVCIPVYNAAKFLSRCLDSLLKQPFPDYELILVDDGSKDESPQICRQYAESHKIIRFVSQANLGPAVARNTALDMAQGDYILFVDSDDEVLPEYFSVLSKVVKEHPSPLYWFGCRHDDGIHQIDKTSPFVFLDSDEKILDFLELQFCKRLEGNHKVLPYSNNCDTHSSCNKVIARSLLTSIRFPVGTVVEEDLRFNLKLLDQTDALCIIPEILYCYYQQSTGSVTTKYNPEKFRSKLEAYKDEMAFAEYHHRPNIRNFFQDSMLSYVSSCVNNLMYSSCPLNYKQKLEEIKKFFLSEETMKASRECRPCSQRTWMMQCLVRYNLYRTCYWLHRLGQCLR